jgi:hypothetical protein
VKGFTLKRILYSIVTAAVLLTSFTPIAPATADTSNPYGTSTVDPAGPNEVILTISKGKRSVSFAFARLEKMKQSSVSIYEPFLKKRQNFSAIPMEKLFALAGISGKDKVITQALNDYKFTATADQFVAAGALLAIKRDGAPIGYDQGGPIRIIFTDKSKWAKNLDAWNWSLATISVK